MKIRVFPACFTFFDVLINKLHHAGRGHGLFFDVQKPAFDQADELITLHGSPGVLDIIF
jgi:hypothetical protein